MTHMPTSTQVENRQEPGRETIWPEPFKGDLGSQPEPFLVMNDFIEVLSKVLGYRPARRTVQRWAQAQGMPYQPIPGSRRRLYKLSWFLDWFVHPQNQPTALQATIDDAHRQLDKLEARKAIAPSHHGTKGEVHFS